MQRNKGSLKFPSNPLARLQELKAEVEQPPKEAWKEASEEGTKEASFEASSAREGAGGEGSLAGLKARLVPQSVKEPTSRLNVELRDSLHTRLKTFCARNKIPIRMVVDVLLEDFLNAVEQEP